MALYRVYRSFKRPILELVLLLMLLLKKTVLFPR